MHVGLNHSNNCIVAGNLFSLSPSLDRHGTGNENSGGRGEEFTAHIQLHFSHYQRRPATTRPVM